MAVNFYIDNRIDKKGDAQIRVSISIKGARYLTSTGYKLPPGKWDAGRHQARKGSSNSSGMTWATINAALSRITDHFNSYESDCMTSGFVPDVASIKKEYARVFGRSGKASGQTADASFWDFYGMFVSETGATNQWTMSTHQKFNALRKHLSEWRDGLSFDDFSEKGFNDFISFLRDVKQMKNSSIGNQLSFVKWFLRWATLKGFNTNTTFQSFSPRLKSASNQVVFLDWDELMTVYNYKVPANGTAVTLRNHNGNEYKKTIHDAAAIEKTRDIFCFCCFTSLRYSDAANLKRANINGDSMTITTVKTADTITIELNKFARAILARYEHRDDLGGYALPHITNQRMNIYVKELCELCQLNEPVTRTYYRGPERIDETLPKYELIGTHTGRRTFICNALMLGIPAEIVMKWTGHSDYKTMKPYIDVTSSAKAQAMDKFNKL